MVRLQLRVRYRTRKRLLRCTRVAALVAKRANQSAQMADRTAQASVAAAVTKAKRDQQAKRRAQQQQRVKAQREQRQQQLQGKKR